MPTFDLIIQNNLGTQVDRMDDISCSEIPQRGDVFTWIEVSRHPAEVSYQVVAREWRVGSRGRTCCLVFVTPKETF